MNVPDVNPAELPQQTKALIPFFCHDEEGKASVINAGQIGVDESVYLNRHKYLLSIGYCMQKYN